MGEQPKFVSKGNFSIEEFVTEKKRKIIETNCIFNLVYFFFHIFFFFFPLANNEPASPNFNGIFLYVLTIKGIHIDSSSQHLLRIAHMVCAYR